MFRSLSRLGVARRRLRLSACLLFLATTPKSRTLKLAEELYAMAPWMMASAGVIEGALRRPHMCSVRKIDGVGS